VMKKLSAKYVKKSKQFAPNTQCTSKQLNHQLLKTAQKTA
jgi:hypothetical protein